MNLKAALERVDSLSFLFNQAFTSAEEFLRSEHKRQRGIGIGSVDVRLRINESTFLFASR